MMNSNFCLVEGVSSAQVLKVVAVGVIALGCYTCKTNAATPGNPKLAVVEREFHAIDSNLFVEDEFIVILNADTRRNLMVSQDQHGRPTVSSKSLNELIHSQGVTRFNRQFKTARPQPTGSKFRDLTGHYKVKIGSNISLNAAMNAFSKNPNVARVEKIGIYPVYGCATGSATSVNDPFYFDPAPGQWSMWDTHGIDADFAWSAEAGQPDVVVVAMDTGVRYNHIDLGGLNPPGPNDNDTNGNIWVNTGEIPGNNLDDDNNGYIDDVIGWDFVSNDPALCSFAGLDDCIIQDNDPSDVVGHGTHISGTMAAISNNDYGIAGVAGGLNDGTIGSMANGVKILPIRVGWQDFLFAYVQMDFVAEGMQYVWDLKVNKGINIAAINASWGSENEGGVGDALANVLAADIMVIKAAGNSGVNTPDYFGSFPADVSGNKIVNVAATTQTGARADFSNYGNWVDIAAPGVEIISTYHDFSDPANDYVAFLDGTSMAAPHVAGVAALLESCDPSLTAAEKLQIIQNTACPANSPNIGGIVNAADALFVAGCIGEPECSVDADCVDNDACTIDTCNNGFCQNNIISCDNGLYCDGVETCVGGSCQPGTPPNCDDGVACTTDSCIEATDICRNLIVHSNCDDGLYCNGAETCDPTKGGCQAGVSPICDDGVGCTDDSCNETTDSCNSISNDSNCDNGLFCDGVEICDPDDDCQPGSNPCGGQSCDESADICVGDCQEDSDCTDGLYCNGIEFCVAGSCQPGTSVDCNDGVSCTVDLCNEITDSCDNDANNGLCDNGLFCDGVETCDVVNDCQAGVAINCNDGVSCTVDSCNEGTNSCDHVINNNLCDNGQFCDGVETCSATLGCQSGNNPCAGQLCDETSDVCDQLGCDNDGACEAGEDCINCPNDCRQKTNGNPNSRFCCNGDLPNCGDSRCSESGWSCGQPVICGNGTCESPEDSCSCVSDCGAPSASESICDDEVDEDCDGAVDCADTDCVNDPVCATSSCGGNKASCSVNSDCCSNNCKNGSCKGN